MAMPDYCSSFTKYGNPSIVYTSAAVDNYFYLSLLAMSIEMRTKFFLCSEDISTALKKILGKNLINKSCVKKFADAFVDTDESQKATKRNVMSIEISKLDSNILETLKIKFTELATLSIDRYIGSEGDLYGKKKTWMISSDFAKIWITDKSTIMLIDEDAETTTLKIRNIFDAKDTAAADYYQIEIETDTLTKLLAFNETCYHPVQFYYFVKLKLAILVQQDKNLKRFFHSDTFKLYTKAITEEIDDDFFKIKK
jgi:hypothetical protein